MSDTYTQLLGWRDYLHVRQDWVRGDAEYFCARAEQLAELVTDLLLGGLSEAAQATLADLANDDMVDFCILVDLAERVDIPEVAPLSAATAGLLKQFLQTEPWQSLAVDTDINVCLAMLRVYGESDAQSMWSRSDPHLLRSLSQVFERVDSEQYGRLVAEINALAGRPDTSFDAEFIALVSVCAEFAAKRLGLAPPVLFN